MYNLPKYKVIQDEELVIVFFPYSLDIISMTRKDFAQTKTNQLEDCSDTFLKKFHQKNSQVFNKANGKNILSKLMLNVTNKCNMNCEYCYASKYNNNQNMSVETIEKVISKFFLSNSVDGINRVVFFGGEPLLHVDGMEYFIHRMEELFSREKISQFPIFNVITNGTIYNSRIAGLFKKYKMGIIVSCDGPPDIQNKQRPFRNSQKESYEIVSRNIKQMGQDGLNIGIECTVTKKALNSGYNYAGLKRFFNSELGVNNVTFVQENITTPEKSFDYSDFESQGNVYFQALQALDYDTDIFEVPYRLLTRNPLTHACGLGRSSFHILADGDVYPCQLIAGLEQFKISNIDTFNDALFLKNNWIQQYKKHSVKCNSCWVKPLCKFCPARQILESGLYTLDDHGCEMQKKQIQELILNVVKLRKNPKRWNDFAVRLRDKALQIEQKIEIRKTIN